MTKKYATSFFPGILLSLQLLLASCGAPNASTPTEIAPTLPLAPTQPPPTATLNLRSVEPSASPTATNEPTPAEVKILPTSYEQPGEWNFQRPYSDPNAPELIIKTLDGFRLDPDFQLASIELTYRWVGIGDRVRDYQRIERRGNGFWNNDTQVSADAISALIRSMVHMHAEPHTLSVTTHTDDYPFWAIELTGVNGESILLYSNSNSRNFVPWNVIYNGEIFAQFDGGIPSALFDLFTVVQGETIASTWGPQEEGYLWATTIEPSPGQLIQGFSGLLPLYDDFGYMLDTQSRELRGVLSGSNWTYHLGVGDVDWSADLQGIELDVENGQTVACPSENVPEDDLFGAYTRFTCPIGEPGAGTSYHFPIRMTFSTSTGKPYTLSGQLFGFYETSAVLPAVPYPEKIGEILESSPLSEDLLRDHIVYAEGSYGLADPLTGRMDHQWEAQLVLLGQAQVGERIVPYTITFDDMKIEDAKVVSWDLDRAELMALLKDVLSQTVTQRYLESDPKPVLNLYYGEVFDSPILTVDELQGCTDLPVAIKLPQLGEPLRGFSFNLPLGTWFFDIQVLLLDDGLRLYDLDINPSSNEDVFWTSMLPASFKPEAAPPFTRITYHRGGPDINVMWAYDASAAEVSYYNAMFTGWYTEQLVYDPGIELLSKELELMPDGRLLLVDCTAP